MASLPRVAPMKYFLLVYDRSRGELAEQPLEFSDHDATLRARFDIELTRRAGDIEVVVLGGEDLESLSKTHPRYFRRSGEPVG